MKVIERLGLWTPREQERRAEHILDHLYDAHITLELFNERGKRVEKVEAENYATDVLLSTIKYFARQYLSEIVAVTTPTNNSSNNGNIDNRPVGSGLSRNSTQISDNPPPFNANSVVLTDASSAEDQTNDRILRGRLAAWSYMDGYTGSDIYRGQQNNTESVATPTKSMFVFDWPTNSGNGNINSVYWTYVNFGGVTGGLGLFSYNGEMWDVNAGPWGSSITGAAPTGFTSGNNGNLNEKGFFLDPDGTHWWTLCYNNTGSTTNLVKRNLSDGAFISSFVLTGGSNYGFLFGFAFDGTNWWTYDANSGSGALRKWNGSGTLLSTTTAATLGISNPSNFSFSGGVMFIDKNNKIWLQSGGSTQIYQIDPSGPTLITTLTLESGAVGQGTTRCGCYFTDATNGDEIWIAGSNSGQAIYRFDLSGNQRGAFRTGFPPNTIPVGIAQSGNSYYALNSFNGSMTDTFGLANVRQFFTRSLLPALVTKNNTQTMKLTYEFDYS
jgi:hypothetical protein